MNHSAVSIRWQAGVLIRSCNIFHVISLLSFDGTIYTENVSSSLVWLSWMNYIKYLLQTHTLPGYVGTFTLGLQIDMTGELLLRRSYSILPNAMHPRPRPRFEGMKSIERNKNSGLEHTSTSLLRIVLYIALTILSLLIQRAGVLQRLLCLTIQTNVFFSLRIRRGSSS